MHPYATETEDDTNRRRLRFMSAQGRASQLEQLIEDAEEHECNCSPEGDYARAKLPGWRGELLELRRREAAEEAVRFLAIAMGAAAE